MFRLVFISIALLFISCASNSSPKDSRVRMKQNALYEKMRKASLVLLVNMKENGSAAFISEDGYIASASHCIQFRDDKLEVVSQQFGRLPVKLIALDKGHDFMLLKADLKGKKATFLPLAKEIPKAPETIFQMGAPVFRRGVVQIGTIARDDTFYEFYGDRHNHYLEIVHVAASMQNGTSGGPWVNQHGEFIGVQSGTLLVGESPSGIAFLSPVTKFRQVIESKQSTQSYNLDFKVLPLEAHSQNTIKRYSNYRDGLVVSEIDEDSIAQQAGLNKWDLIIAVNDHPVKSIKELMDKIRSLQQKSVKFTILELDKKDSKIKTIPVEIVEDRISFKNPPKKVAE